MHETLATMSTSLRSSSALRRRVAHLVDLVVDRRVLLDVRVGRRDVRLGLVVVVVADEVATALSGKSVAELVVELRRERLVGRDHERRLVHRGDDVRHGEGLAGAGDAEQHLVAARPSRTPAVERRDRLRLIALRREVGLEPERALAAHDVAMIAAARADAARRVALRAAVWFTGTSHGARRSDHAAIRDRPRWRRSACVLGAHARPARAERHELHVVNVEYEGTKIWVPGTLVVKKGTRSSSS